MDFEVDEVTTEYLRIHNIPLTDIEISCRDRTKRKDRVPQEWLSRRSQLIGRWGEKFALNALSLDFQERYPNSKLEETSLGYVLLISNRKVAEIIWCNKDKETNSSPDIITKEKQNDRYWEVKTTTNEELTRIIFSESERRFAIEKGKKYNLLIVTNAGLKFALVHQAPNPFRESDPADPASRALGFYEGVGRRKRSTARVRIIVDGCGTIIINNKKPEQFFKREGDYAIAIEPHSKFSSSQLQNSISIVVRGGGNSGQRDAIRLGLARALMKLNPELRRSFRELGYLTRDSRIKERKKPGLKRARKAPTYTKR
jgi:small subunit ribosomal protein S9